MADKIEDLDEKYKRLSRRRDSLQQDKTRIEAELEARKRALKSQMEAAKKEGYNPDNLQEDIRKNEEILALKLDNFEAELADAERVMKPMLEEIKG
jgi:DNA repair exonuclease SbcCD ATPase subunit